MKHELKTWPKYFQAVWVGDKSFEIRKNDRNFKERDEVVLQEWEPHNMGEEYSHYTGREIDGFIRYITTDFLPNGMCVFEFQKTSQREN